MSSSTCPKRRRRSKKSLHCQMGATCTSVPRGKYSSSFASGRKVTCSASPSTGLAMTIASMRPCLWSPGAPPRIGRNTSSSECAARMPHTQPPAMSGALLNCSWTQAPPTSLSDLVLYALTREYSTLLFADKATCRALRAAAKLQRSRNCVRLDMALVVRRGGALRMRLQGGLKPTDEGKKRPIRAKR